MISSSKIFAFLYICVFTLYFTWGFTKLLGLAYIFVDVRLHAKEIIIAIAYLASAFSIDYLLPKSIEKYAYPSFILSLAIINLIVPKSLSDRQQALGELLFRSEYLSKTIYYLIPFGLIYLWALYRQYRFISNQTASSTIDVGGVEVNSYLWSACLITVLISAAIHISVISWNKLEIRDKGVWYGSYDLTWRKIVDYSWSDSKPNLLLIRHINGYKNEIEAKYSIVPGEKEEIDNILRDKLGN